MFEIKKLFAENELTETNAGYKLVCPSCGLQGGRTEGFILFPENNNAFCHTSQRHFNLLETYALKKGIIKCLDGRESGSKEKILKGDLFTQTLDALKEEFSQEDYDDILESMGIKKEIELPNNGKLISEFAFELAKRIKREEIFFYRNDTKKIVEIGKIRQANDNIFYNGFVDVDGNRYITLVERYFKPWCNIYTKQGPLKIYKSMNASVANVVLVSNNFRDEMPIINRIFNVQIPIVYDNILTFPNKGYDKRFASWLPYNAPTINPGMSLEEAKKIIQDLFGDFCFKSEQDKTNAIAGFITPYLRGLFTAFNIRTPVFIYEANRERAGKDYLAGLTGILYEGCALEEPPLSSGDKFQNNSDELRKKIHAAFMYGRKRLHFSNNKGHLNNAVFESITTAEKYSDRTLGKSEVLIFDNELDFSLSGNIGMTLTPDLANRSRFVRLFLDIEDANSRVFKNPNLHQWLNENRSLVLSALYCFVNHWINTGMKSGSIPFASFSQWAKVCGGIMEACELGNPCIQTGDVTGIAVDNDTADMKTLFELCYEHKPNVWLKKADIVDLIKSNGEDLFSGMNWESKSDQTSFGTKFIKYVGRILSGIRLQVKDNTARTVRWDFKFVKENGHLGHVGHLKQSVNVLDQRTIGDSNIEKDCMTESGNLGNVTHITNTRTIGVPQEIDHTNTDAILIPQVGHLGYLGHLVTHLQNTTLSIHNTTGLEGSQGSQGSQSTREVQFWEAEECKNIKPNFTKEDVLEWINLNSKLSSTGNGLKNYSRKDLYDKFGVGCIKFEMELAKDGLI